MSENIDYTKLVNLIVDEQFDTVIQEILIYQKDNSDTFQLALLKLFCLIRTKKIHSARVELNKLLSLQPDHELLKLVSLHLDANRSERESTNPLEDFVTAFIQYNQSGISQFSEKQLNALLNQIITKPYIK